MSEKQTRQTVIAASAVSVVIVRFLVCCVQGRSLVN